MKHNIDYKRELRGKIKEMNERKRKKCKKRSVKRVKLETGL